MKRSKLSASAGGSSPTAPASSPPWIVETTQRFDKLVERLPREERSLIDSALTRFPAAFGQPHIHAGLGIRRLARKPPLFECRAGRAIRLIFEVGPRRLTFDFAGNHDEVQVYLRSHC